MMKLESDTNWIQHGRQKSAVAQVLRSPMTASEIWREAQTVNAHIQLRDVWLILRQSERRGLVHCYSRGELTGKVYYWTDQGRAAIEQAFRIALPPPPQGIRWVAYSRVWRAKARRLVLLELAHAKLPEDNSASRIRRAVNDRHPLGLNSVIRVLNDLVSLRLVVIEGHGGKRGQKHYRLTPSGQRIATLLVQTGFRTDRSQSLLNASASSSP